MLESIETKARIRSRNTPPTSRGDERRRPQPGEERGVGEGKREGEGEGVIHVQGNNSPLESALQHQRNPRLFTQRPRAQHGSEGNRRLQQGASTAVCLFVGCLTSQQQASVSQGRICEDNFTCCHTEIQAADQTFYLTQSQYTDTGPTSPVLTL